MSEDNQEQQKSPKRRFLLILGVTAFTCFIVLGLLIIFWDKFPLEMPQTRRTIFGSIILLYAVLRFSRYLRKDPNER
ncbi:hypothetical protein CKK33_05150 [Mucilaginibacter sp. MD40]|uniref:hypothetical protein n=1 Tax=Mucilaginibacter sp. MD40 TaxID=2029590 RepID=UPI000BACAFF4|nr:hypothetical protein [Mucilaginibacter sp. MD40]PAW92908.1 hypothetical protein CKK33_05150 [Mucilaginibacter sp. MD40]